MFPLDCSLSEGSAVRQGESLAFTDVNDASPATRIRFDVIGDDMWNRTH